jgi:hypothetical protein
VLRGGEMNQITAEAQENNQPKKKGGKLPTPVDHRTRVGRRVLALRRIFRQRLGSDVEDPVLASAVDRTAQLVALAESLSARSIRGEAIAADDVVRMHRLADLHLRRLKLDRHDVRTRTESVDEYVARTYGNGESAT